SVIKRLFSEHITSRLVRTQNRELSFRCIAYNTHRMINLFSLVMISEPSQPTLLKYYNFNNIFGASLDVKETHRDLREVLYSTNTPR
ncbi:MAG TPA: hypothetical protein VKA95_12875, partial [Nitrososphaeraceae archaeon]|nr:hypothetical protein [Nitrososphaeraceae archaeon]